jgi:hypothetical protein
MLYRNLTLGAILMLPAVSVTFLPICMLICTHFKYFLVLAPPNSVVQLCGRHQDFLGHFIHLRSASRAFLPPYILANLNEVGSMPGICCPSRTDVGPVHVRPAEQEQCRRYGYTSAWNARDITYISTVWRRFWFRRDDGPGR